MLFATALSAFVVIGVVATTTFLKRMSWSQTMIADRDQNLRAAVDLLSRDLRMAGYGVTLPASNLASWISWVSGATNAVLSTAGGSATTPDSLTLVFARDVPARVRSATYYGDRRVPVTAVEPFSSADTPLVLVGGVELARLVSLDSDSILLSRHLTNSAVGLAYPYKAGSSLEALTVVTYTCASGGAELGSRPYLTRDDHTSATDSALERLAISDIENLKVAPSSNSVQVAVTARSSAPDPRWTDPVRGDRYRRKTITFTVQRRNTP